MPSQHDAYESIHPGAVVFTVPQLPAGLFNLSETSLHFHRTPTNDEWHEIGESLARMQRSMMWVIGDWLLAGESAGYIQRGKLDEACEVFGIAYDTAHKAAQICRAYESGMRIPDLSFTHHTLVANRDDAQELLELAAEKRMSVRELRAEKKRRDGDTSPTDDLTPHVTHNSGNNEWYTPPEFIESARAVMGGIDLDPASSDKAQEWVQAEKYFTADDDGLQYEWSGRVWMNPPYGRELIEQFCRTLVDSYLDQKVTQACVLVNNATETSWFQLLLSESSVVCFVNGRIRFLDERREPANAPLQGQAILYFGSSIESFANEFSQYGPCVNRIQLCQAEVQR